MRSSARPRRCRQSSRSRCAGRSRSTPAASSARLWAGPADEQPDPKDSLAVAFAEAVATDHTAISDAQLEILFEEFTIPQVVELLTWISFEYAGQMLGALIGDEPATAEQRAAFEVSVAAQPRP
jgi:hypothetical protein